MKCISIMGVSWGEKWSKSIAVGSKGFMEEIKFLLGVMAKGRKSLEATEDYQLRDPSAPYSSHFDVKNEDIVGNNIDYWDINNEYSQDSLGDPTGALTEF